MFAAALHRGQAGRQAAAGEHDPGGWALLSRGGGADADRAARGLRLGARHSADRRRRRTGAARLPAEQLHALPDLRRARQRGRRRELRRRLVRLSFGLAFGGAIMLATLSIAFTAMAEDSSVLPPAAQEQVAQALEDDAQVMSDTQLEAQLDDQPTRSRTRSSPSTPTRGRSRCRWRSSSRSSPACSGSSTGSG